MNKPIILVIDNSISITGALKSIVNVALDNKHDFDFHFAIPTNSSAKDLLFKKGFTHVKELHMVELSKRPFTILSYMPLLFYNSIILNRYILYNKISVIHVNDIYNLIPVVIKLFNRKVAYFCHIRFLPNRFPVWLFNFWFKLHNYHCEQLIAVSERVKSLIPTKVNVEVIYDCLPHDDAYPMGIAKSDNRFCFLYLSNLIPGKGHDHALEAFSIVHREIPNWRLRFVGSTMGLESNDKYHQLLKNKAVEMGIIEKIEWAALTQDVELEYKRADIVLNFSESESFSMTCLEALYYGRPLIATNSGGPAEIVENEVNGLLIPNKDIGAMAKAMRKLAIDEGTRNSLAKLARESVSVKFSKQNTSERINLLYKSILWK